MNTQANKIHFPKSGEAIDVNKILYHQLDAELKKKYQDELVKEKSRFSELQNRIDEQKAQIEKQKSEYHVVPERSVGS